MCFAFVVSLIPRGKCETRQLRYQLSLLEDGSGRNLLQGKKSGNLNRAAACAAGRCWFVTVSVHMRSHRG